MDSVSSLCLIQQQPLQSTKMPRRSRFCGPRKICKQILHEKNAKRFFHADVQTDFMKEINKIVPWEDGYLHMEGNAAAHLKASIMGFSETVIIKDGRLVLGTWQGIYFLEYDGARNRKVIVKIQAD